MRKIDFNKIKYSDLLDHSAISQEFKRYLMVVMEYSPEEADFVVSTDFKNPYNTPYITMEYEGCVKLEGKTYEILSCKTDFRGMLYLRPDTDFEFFMLTDVDSLENNTVGAYAKADKMYLL